MVCDVVWEEIENGYHNMVDYEEVSIIGSGGNINKLLKCQVKLKINLVLYLCKLAVLF
jgi:exopolyphosphatase/guanosine-5'-triphosphate,3'-diphosphate pyrophosphatase